MASWCRGCGTYHWAGGCAPRRPSPVDRAAAEWLIENVDWDRLGYLLLYALTHGGNLPSGALVQTERGGDR